MPAADLAERPVERAVVSTSTMQFSTLSAMTAARIGTIMMA